MSLQSAIEHSLPLLRAEAESRMTDTCQITIPGSGAGTIDPVTLARIPATPVTVYEGPCRLGRVQAPTTSQAAAGEATWDTQDSVLHLPIEDSELVRPGATVTYLTSERNPALEGHVFGVIGVVDGTDLTARRCRVREVVA